MPRAVPIVLVPGLNCSARLYAEQIPALWRFGPVTVADHTRDDSMAAIAARILAHGAAALCARRPFDGRLHRARRSCGRRPSALHKLALLDTSARPETPEQSERRKPQIALAEAGRFAEVPTAAVSGASCIATAQHDDGAQSASCGDGRGNRRRGLRAPAEGDHDAAGLAAAAGLDRAVRRWCWSAMATNSRRRRCRRRSPPASTGRGSSSSRIAGTSRPWSGRKQ